MTVPKPTLLIACGALALEITQLIEINNWRAFEVTCLPAKLHNTPDQIVPAMREKISAAKASGKYDGILALYGDCGTGGMLDELLNAEGVERIPGAHCYEFYTGSNAFEALVEEEIGTFYLTDYLARFFERLIMEGMGINKHPELLPMYFGNYKRLVYLAQTDNPEIDKLAEAAADRLGLAYEKRKTEYGELSTFMAAHADKEPTWQK